MSEFSEFQEECRGAFGEALELTGTTPFEIGSKIFYGDLSELGNQSYTIVIGGQEISVSAQLLCPIEQFSGDLPPAGARIKIKNRLFAVAAFSEDEISVTLSLADANAH